MDATERVPPEKGRGPEGILGIFNKPCSYKGKGERGATIKVAATKADVVVDVTEDVPLAFF